MSDYMDEMSNSPLNLEQSKQVREAMIGFNHAVMAKNATEEAFRNSNGEIAPRVMRMQNILLRDTHNRLLEVLQKVNFPNYMPITLGTLHTLLHAELRKRTDDNADEVLDAIANIVRELRFYGEGDLT